MPPRLPPDRVTPTGVPLYLLRAPDPAPAPALSPPAPAQAPAPAARVEPYEDEVVAAGAVQVLEELRLYITRSLRDYLAALPAMLAQYHQVGAMPSLPTAIDTLCDGTVPNYHKGARVRGAHAYLLLDVPSGTAMLSVPLGEKLVRAWEAVEAAQAGGKATGKAGLAVVPPEDADEE